MKPKRLSRYDHPVEKTIRRRIRRHWRRLRRLWSVA